MNSQAAFIIDENELRAAAYAALIAPWACRAETELRIKAALADVGDVSDYDTVIFVLCAGSASLHDQWVAHVLAEHQHLYAKHPLIVVSDRLERQEIFAAIRSGLRGFIPTQMPSHVALAAIQFIMAGGTYIPHSPLVPQRSVYTELSGVSEDHGADSMSLPASSSGDLAGMAACADGTGRADAQIVGGKVLKQRHIEVLMALKQGHANKVIGRQLQLTESTVKLYVRQLMKIFDAKNRTELALKAFATPQGGNPVSQSRPDARQDSQINGPMPVAGNAQHM